MSASASKLELGPGRGVAPPGLKPEVAARGCARCPPPSEPALSRGPDLDSGAESTLANFNGGAGPATPWESPGGPRAALLKIRVACIRLVNYQRILSL